LLSAKLNQVRIDSKLHNSSGRAFIAGAESGRDVYENTQANSSPLLGISPMRDSVNYFQHSCWRLV